KRPTQKRFPGLHALFRTPQGGTNTVGKQPTLSTRPLTRLEEQRRRRLRFSGSPYLRHCTAPLPQCKSSYQWAFHTPGEKETRQWQSEPRASTTSRISQQIFHSVCGQKTSNPFAA